MKITKGNIPLPGEYAFIKEVENHISSYYFILVLLSNG